MVAYPRPRSSRAADGVVGQHGRGAIERDEVRRDRALVDSHEADRKPRRLLAGKTRLVHPDDALLLLADAQEQDRGLLPDVAGLSMGTIGTPRQVRNGAPNIVTVAGGTPRRVHSRPNAAIARGCARKNDGSFQTFVSSSSRVVGRRRARARLDALAGRNVLEQPVAGVVDAARSPGAP